MKKIFTILCLLFLSGKDFSYEQIILNAPYVLKPDTILVYLPAKYSTAKQYPLVMLLHGWHQTYKFWNQVAGDLQKYADRYNFILVCPDGFWDSWYIDSPVNPRSKVETFFIKNIIPTLTSKYKVDKKNIFITGLSMGGHGSMYLFLKHPDIFKSAGSLSGTLDVSAFPNKNSMINAFGKYEVNPDNWKKNSVYNLLDNIKGKNKQIIFDCGTEDNLYFCSKKFYEKCLDLKIKATFISQPGVHKIDYWRKTFENHFRFFQSLVSK